MKNEGVVSVWRPAVGLVCGSLDGQGYVIPARSSRVSDPDVGVADPGRVVGDCKSPTIEGMTTWRPAVGLVCGSLDGQGYVIP